MKLTPSRTYPRDICTRFRSGTLGGLTDGQLLERFATGAGEGVELAFSALVERHWPMVLRVCRSLLRDDHEALDAFQATFLALADGVWLTRGRQNTDGPTRYDRPGTIPPDPCWPGPPFHTYECRARIEAI